MTAVTDCHRLSVVRFVILLRIEYRIRHLFVCCLAATDIVTMPMPCEMRGSARTLKSAGPKFSSQPGRADLASSLGPGLRGTPDRVIRSEAPDGPSLLPFWSNFAVRSENTPFSRNFGRVLGAIMLHKVWGPWATTVLRFQNWKLFLEKSCFRDSL